MAKFVVLVNWTEEGVREFRDTLQRTKDVQQLAERLGGSMETLYWTMGAYDLVAFVDMPDDETATAFALGVSSRGKVRTTTMRAFGADEMQGILDKAG